MAIYLRDYISVKQAAALLACTPARVYQLLDRGAFTRYIQGGYYLLLRSEVEALAERRRQQASLT